MDKQTVSPSQLVERVRVSTEIEAWTSIRKWLESANMTLCGDPKTARDISAAIQLFKDVLIRRTEDKIRALKAR